MVVEPAETTSDYQSDKPFIKRSDLVNLAFETVSYFCIWHNVNHGMTITGGLSCPKVHYGPAVRKEQLCIDTGKKKNECQLHCRRPT